jgi:hypothetical protein
LCREIITTPQGLAVVVQVLPTTFNVGTQVLGQVVAEPLGGGVAPPPSGPSAPSGPPALTGQPGTPFASVRTQTAAAFVASVIDQPPTAPTSDDTNSASGAAAARGSSPGSTVAQYFAAAAKAYQSTEDRSDKPGPQIILTG